MLGWDSAREDDAAEARPVRDRMGRAVSALASTGIYVITQGLDQARVVSFYDFASKKMKKVFDLKKYAINPAISPDGKTLVYVQVDQHDSTLMLVKNFR